MKKNTVTEGDITVTVTIEPTQPPEAGTEYYTVEDMQRALTDMGYHGVEKIIDKLRQKLAVRNDGRYSLDELKTGWSQTNDMHCMDDYYNKKLDNAAVQARKNRLWDAHK